jgi:hypothetical protein
VSLFTGNFVSIRTSDLLDLDALWCPPSQQVVDSLVLIHIHGKAGNFYHNEFLRQMYSVLPALGIGVLGLNTRGAGTLVEGFRGDDVDYVGAATETLDESLLDIDAAIGFVEAQGMRPVLQGHSHGCEKLLWWGSRRTAKPTVMLSPADSAALQRNFCGRADLVAYAQAASIGLDSPWDLLPEATYGVDVHGTRYLLPVTRHSFLDAVLGPSIYLLDSTKPSEALLAHQGEVMVLIGDADPLQLPSASEFGCFLGLQRPDWEVKVLENCDHHFHGRERQIIQLVIDFCESVR